MVDARIASRASLPTGLEPLHLSHPLSSTTDPTNPNPTPPQSHPNLNPTQPNPNPTQPNPPPAVRRAHQARLVGRLQHPRPLPPRQRIGRRHRAPLVHPPGSFRGDDGDAPQRVQRAVQPGGGAPAGGGQREPQGGRAAGVLGMAHRVGLSVRGPPCPGGVGLGRPCAWCCRPLSFPGRPLQSSL